MSIRSAYNSDLTLHNLTITGQLILNNPVPADNDIEVTDIMALNIDCSDIVVSNSVQCDTVTATGTIQCEELDATTLSVSGSGTINGSLDVVNNVVCSEIQSSSINTTGTIQCNALNTSGTANIGGNLDVSGSLECAQFQPSSITTTGNVQCNTVNAAVLNASGTATVQGDFLCDSVITASEVKAQSYLTCQTLSASGTASIGSNATVGGTLGVTGNVTCAQLQPSSITTSGNVQCNAMNATTGTISGNLSCYDTINAADITASGSVSCASLTVTGSNTTTINSVYTTTLNVTGNSNVVGASNFNGSMTVNNEIACTSIYADNPNCTSTFAGPLVANNGVYINGINTPTFEILYVNVSGNASTASGTLALKQNKTYTTVYSVFPSVYYGFSGSSGTYSAMSTSSSINNIIISNITADSFVWNLEKQTGNNVNIYLVFMVVYNGVGNTYPIAY